MKDTQDAIEYNGNNKAEDMLKWALNNFHPNIALACSFETPILVHMAVAIKPDVRIFSIDTGRLPEETYQCAHELEQRYGIKIEWYFPKNNAVEKLERGKGVYSFKESLEARHECCAIRKVEPLSRALNGLKAWITGLRKDQNVTRNELGKVERDVAHGGIIKINPIADWSLAQVMEYTKKHDIPYNQLLDQDYMSIGCACCTRPVTVGEDPRSGRWWWEQPEHKECGLHVRNWNI
ncbi:phosphoadenylyl-sulfate reductase [Verrucomicrobiota bacterium]